MCKNACSLIVLGIGLGLTLLAGGHQAPQTTETPGAATMQLAAENELILQVLDAAQFEADQIRQGFDLDKKRVMDILNFSRNFTDRCHFEKEEEYYFPAAQVYAGPRIYGFLGELEIGYAYGRSVLEEIDSLLDHSGREQSQLIAQRLAAYAKVLRRTIRRENEQLYAKAHTFLSATEERALLIGFRRIDLFATLDFGDGFHKHYRQLGEQLGQWAGGQ